MNQKNNKSIPKIKILSLIISKIFLWLNSTKGKNKNSIKKGLFRKVKIEKMTNNLKSKLIFLLLFFLYLKK